MVLASGTYLGSPFLEASRAGSALCFGHDKITYIPVTTPEGRPRRLLTSYGQTKIRQAISSSANVGDAACTASEPTS